MKIVEGEIIPLSNNKEYICLKTLTKDDVDYMYLMSNFKPLEVKFAKQNIVNGEVEITIINNQAEKEQLLYLFQATEQN